MSDNIFELTLCDITGNVNVKTDKKINKSLNIPFEDKPDRIKNPSITVAKRYLLEDLYNFPKYSKKRVKYSNEQIIQYVLHAADIAGFKVLNSKELSHGSVNSNVIYSNRKGKVKESSYNSYMTSAIYNGFERHKNGELWNYDVKDKLPVFDDSRHPKLFEGDFIKERYNKIFEVLSNYKLIEIINNDNSIMNSSCIAITPKGVKREYKYPSIAATAYMRNNRNCVSNSKVTKIVDKLDTKTRKLIEAINDTDKVIRNHKRICAILGFKYIETTLKDAKMNKTRLKYQKDNGTICEAFYGSVYCNGLRGYKANDKMD